jgi:hypothetical protein
MSDTFQAQNMRLVGYFPAGAIHAQNYQVADIPAIPYRQNSSLGEPI